MKLVPHWRRLWRAWTMRLAALGLTLPQLLQFVADNSRLLPWFNEDWKTVIYLLALAGVMLTRPIEQKAVSGDAPAP